MFYLSVLTYSLCAFNAVCVDWYKRAHLVCDREILFGVCDPCGPMGFEGTIFSWLGAWGMKEGGEVLKSS